MNFTLTAEQTARYEDIVAFARTELDADVLSFDREGSFNRENWKRCGEKGILGSHVPKEFGGQGMGALDTVLTLEALGYGCRDNGLTLALGGQMWSVQEPILTYGTDEQKRRFLPGLCAGDLIGAHGVSEEHSGSDALSLRTTATKTDGGYVLNGRKTYIGMAPLADVALVLANADPDAGSWGVSAFLVECDAEGLSRSEPYAKTGTRTNLLGDLVLEDCFVADENVLGREGVGISLFTRTIGWERAFIHAGHLGSMQALLERSIEFARQRRQFGQPIGKFQSVSNRIADMRLGLETARLLMYKVAAMKDEGLDASLETAMAKLHISEVLLDCATNAVRIHGARGYLEMHEVERELRDSIGGVIYAGTSDIQRNLIAGLLGL
ncbi:MAG: acyl-CoA dehydrogenase family protein [Gemmatimonadetes bacterium]|nr:acyl-CoA dehydrogenase family protein [Gemmatimonadota bacterium]